ncbi:MAG: ASKHA domain-containing protein [Oscillospiraceae bacterium]|nr:ASKHA domain-containing protein [Oscillospiraceae bacterium]
MSRVTIVQGIKTREYNVASGTTLLELLRLEGYSVPAPCGGNGTCGKCLVSVETAGERHIVRACSTTLRGDCRIILPQDNEITETAGSVSKACGCGPLGVAVDLGTTTVAAELVELETGTVIASTAARNVQAPYGADVISRIQYIMTHPDGLSTLSGIIREQVTAMAETLCETAGANFPQLQEISIAGNTIMQHIYAELDPSPIATYPFPPKTLFDGEASSRIKDLVPPVRFCPCVSGYVGGDIVAGLYAAGFHEKTGNHLFLDIGTNGEMALLSQERLLACSVASGPAFEGAEISCGMLYGKGAIHRVSHQGSMLKLQVAGGCTPRGLCGSGLIDLLAALLELGVVDETGRLLPPDEASAVFGAVLEEDENENGILYLSTDRQVFFSQADVRKLQLAKAALAAGIEILLTQAGISPEQLDTLSIAGAFGSSLMPESAMKIGMIPEIPTEKLRVLGNTALEGARLAMTSQEAEAAMLELQKRCQYLELSGNAAFSDAFVDHMSFEEED